MSKHASDHSPLVDQLLATLQGALPEGAELNDLISYLQSLAPDQAESVFERAEIHIDGKGNIVGNNNHVLYVEGAGAAPVAEMLRQIWQRAAYATGEFARPSLAVHDFLVSQDEQLRIHKVMPTLPERQRAADVIALDKVPWIVGPSGAWKRYLAVCLAMDTQPGGKIYNIPRWVSWTQLGALDIEGCSFVLPDALGAARFERESLEAEVGRLFELRSRGNVVITTSPDDIFIEAMKDTRIADLVASETVVRINTGSFNTATKTKIYNQLVDYAHDHGLITDAQQKWARALTETASQRERARLDPGQQIFRHLLTETWLPSDIEFFVTDGVRQASSQSDLRARLQRDTNIDNRIRNWFADLDASTRCFVLTMTVFAGLETRDLWGKYKEVVMQLRMHDPSLSALPIGFLRQRAAQYVTVDGAPDFINARAFQAVARELVKNYREYFVELIASGLFSEWSASDLNSGVDPEEQERRIQASESVRNAIGRMVGELAKYGLQDVTDLLYSWASHPRAPIRKTAGIALRQLARDPSSMVGIQSLLHAWSRDYGSAGHFRRWTCASALWRLATIEERADLQDFALRSLFRLADDSNDYVVRSVAYALPILAGIVPPQDLSPLLTRVAGSNDLRARQSAASALAKAVRRDPKAMAQLLSDWLAGDDVHVRRTGIHVLLTARDLPHGDRFGGLETLLRANPVDFVHVAYQLVGEAGESAALPSILPTLAGSGTNAFRSLLVDGLVNAYKAEPAITQKLLVVFAEYQNTEVAGLEAAVQLLVPQTIVHTLLTGGDTLRGDVIARLTQISAADPTAFVAGAIDALADHKTGTPLKVLEALADLPVGLADILAGAYRAKPVLTQRLLSLLYSAGPPSLRSLSASVHGVIPQLAILALLTFPDPTEEERCSGVRNLMRRSPLEMATGFEHVTSAGVDGALAWRVMTTLAREPGELVGALVSAYRSDPIRVQRLLSRLWHSTDVSLKRIVAAVDSHHSQNATYDLFVVHKTFTIAERSARLWALAMAKGRFWAFCRGCVRALQTKLIG